MLTYATDLSRHTGTVITCMHILTWNMQDDYFDVNLQLIWYGNLTSMLISCLHIHLDRYM